MAMGEGAQRAFGLAAASMNALCVLSAIRTSGGVPTTPVLLSFQRFADPGFER
jgi:hypothetical protein